MKLGMYVLWIWRHNFQEAEFQISAPALRGRDDPTRAGYCTLREVLLPQLNSDEDITAMQPKLSKFIDTFRISDSAEPVSSRPTAMFLSESRRVRD